MHILTVEVTLDGGVRFVMSEGLDDVTGLGAIRLVEQALVERIAEAKVRAKLAAADEQ